MQVYCANFFTEKELKVWVHTINEKLGVKLRCVSIVHVQWANRQRNCYPQSKASTKITDNFILLIQVFIMDAHVQQCLLFTILAMSREKRKKFHTNF